MLNCLNSYFDRCASGFTVDFACEMTERVVIRRELYERWKLAVTNLLDGIAAWRERTARLEMRDVRRQSGYLIQLALLRGRIRHGAKQTFGVGISRHRKQVGSSRLLENLSGVHDDHVVSHTCDDAEVVSYQDDAG